jgi:hypothetical protein
MPRQKGVRSYNTGQAQEPFSADGLTLNGQSAPLIIIESGALAQLLFEHTDFLLEVFNNNLLVQAVVFQNRPSQPRVRQNEW